jgi:hypothetical protein
MSMLQALRRLDSAAAVFLGPHGAASQHAQQRGISRQALYRQADAALADLDADIADARLEDARQQIRALQQHLDHLQKRLEHALVVGPEQLAQFVACAQANGTSLSTARALLVVLLGEKAPSVPKLGRLAQSAGRQASATLAVLDSFARPKARQIAADEIFSGRRPVLMTVEQDSLCWLGGRLAPCRDGEEWAKEFAQLPAAQQVTRDGGQGMAKGVKAVNKERQKNKQAALADQDDHFHILHRARRAVRQVRSKAAKALHQAEEAQRKLDRVRRAGRHPKGLASAAHHWWQKAEQAFDRWSEQERCFERLRAALRLFTPQGQLNTRQRGEAEVAAALAGLSGPEWTRVKRRLVGPGAFTYLDRVHERLAALPVEPGLVRAALRAEGLRRQPEALRGSDASAAAARATLVVASVTLALAPEAGAEAVELVRGVLRGAWSSSSLVEGLNSVLRMQQARQKRLSQGLLDLKRLYWNTHVFVAGKRKRQAPYERLGLVLPKGSWWDLLQIPPEQLRRQLSALNPAA